ncbi:MAG TPA: hypothetical protein VFR41_05315 [Acidimicrobiia bacterium]|nr:hypothetical protein [Acidimicrobiia bacterium]
MDSDDLTRITPTQLRRADDPLACRRKLALELRGRYANANANARFEAMNRVEGDARLAQAEAGPVRSEAFVDPAELEHEQRALYHAAVAGYRTLFGSTDGRIVDFEWRAELSELGAVVTAKRELAFEADDGRREIRRLRVGARNLLDDVDVQVALLITDTWARDQLDIVAADLIDLRVVKSSPMLPERRDEAREWIADRIATLRAHAADGRARAGGDCLGCPFVAGCEAHA